MGGGTDGYRPASDAGAAVGDVGDREDDPGVVGGAAVLALDVRVSRRCDGLTRGRGSGLVAFTVLDGPLTAGTGPGPPGAPWPVGS